MPFVVIAVFLTVILVAIALIPLSIVLRYRAGTIRRPARQWVTTLNVVMLTMSALFFLTAAAMTNVWVPSAFVYALAGLGVGALLGAIGLVLTKWETSGRTMVHHTQSVAGARVDRCHCGACAVRLLAQLARVANPRRRDDMAGRVGSGWIAGGWCGGDRVLPVVFDWSATTNDRTLAEDLTVHGLPTVAGGYRLTIDSSRREGYAPL